MWRCVPPQRILVPMDTRQALLNDARRLRAQLADAATRADLLADADRVELQSRLHQIEVDLDKLVADSAAEMD